MSRRKGIGSSPNFAAQRRGPVSTVRVIGGSHRGRKIVLPSSDDVRPTANRVREAIFNSLDARGLSRPARALDLFAGSGAMGIEAISRGAQHVTFVEQARDVSAQLIHNLRALDVADRATVVSAGAHEWLTRNETEAIEFDVAWCDPPYSFADWPRLLGAVRARLVVAETGVELGDVCDRFEIDAQRRYGRTWITYFQQR